MSRREKNSKPEYTNTIVETVVRIIPLSDGEIFRDISSSDDYSIHVAKGVADGRNYNEEEWADFYELKFIGAANNNLLESIKRGDRIRVRGTKQSSFWKSKEGDEMETSTLTIDLHSGGFWAHDSRWDASVTTREPWDGDEDGGSSKSKGRRNSARDDDEDDEDEKPRRSVRGRAKDDDDDDDESPRAKGRRGRSRDDDDDDEEEKPRRGRSRARDDEEEEEEEDEKPRRGRSRAKDDDDDDEEEDKRPRRRGRRRGDDDDD